MAKINKPDLIEIIKAKGEYTTNVDAEKALNSTIEGIKDVLLHGNSIALKGFGSFEVMLKPERSGLVPGTDKTYTKPAHYAPKFSVSGSLVTEVADKVKA